MSQKIKVGVVGATGLVGEVFLKLLEERRFPVQELRLFASDRSAGTKLSFAGQKIEVNALSPTAFDGLDLVFFSSGDDISKEWAPRAVKSGAIAVDNSNAFRMDSSVELIVPEVNGERLAHRTPRVIANPNCSTIQLVCALKPLMQDFGLESVHVASYQAISGAGRPAYEEFTSQLRQVLAGEEISEPQVFPHPIAQNCIPQIGGFDPSGFCTEELKIMRESKKILGLPDLRITAFTVRIPSWNAHAEAVWVRLGQVVDREQILASLGRGIGLRIEDDPKKSVYPTPLRYSGSDPVGVGRLHQDPDDPQTWLMWVVADNLRKGAALNGIQIAERVFEIASH
ncbi:MAG: aspartate-semialdehyde dehydrogenase [Bdellovibrionales bacterium]